MFNRAFFIVCSAAVTIDKEIRCPVLKSTSLIECGWCSAEKARPTHAVSLQIFLKN